MKVATEKSGLRDVHMNLKSVASVNSVTCVLASQVAMRHIWQQCVSLCSTLCVCQKLTELAQTQPFFGTHVLWPLVTLFAAQHTLRRPESLQMHSQEKLGRETVRETNSCTSCIRFIVRSFERRKANQK